MPDSNSVGRVVRAGSTARGCAWAIILTNKGRRKSSISAVQCCPRTTLRASFSSQGQSSGEDRLRLPIRSGGGEAGKMGSATVDAVRFVHPCTSHRHPPAQCVKGQARTMPPDQRLSVKSAVTIADETGDRDGRLPDEAQRQLIGRTCRYFFSVHPLSVFGCVR